MQRDSTGVLSVPREWSGANAKMCPLYNLYVKLISVPDRKAPPADANLVES